MKDFGDDAGAALPEYAVVISLIALAAFVAAQAFGGTVLGLFDSAVDAIP